MNREELLKKIDEQLVFELQSGYEYKQMASEFNDMDWDGFEHFMEMQAHEEYEHAEYFRKWLLNTKQSKLQKLTTIKMY